LFHLQRPATEAEAIIAYETLYPHRQMLWFQETNQNRGEYFKLSQAHWSNVHSYLFRILERGITVHENWKHLTPDVDRLSPPEIDLHTKIALQMILAGIQNKNG
jgi:TetR/AcrR family transcriptional regulator